MTIISPVPVLVLTVPPRADKVVAEGNLGDGTKNKDTLKKVRPVDAKKYQKTNMQRK